MKLLKTFFLILFVSIVVASCERDSSISSTGDIEKDLSKASDSLVINLKYGEEVHLSNYLSLKFDDLLEESRCPIDFNCIWAGNAKIRMYIKEGNGGKNFELNTGAGVTHDVYGKYDFRIEELTPYPESTIPLNKYSYEATIVIKRL
ncbi:MAG: hypothetical protein M0P71_02975 [Melioribacteraceae bacterium]|jgi:hypothetical protein|nr:hypothetical protein [Melioribacteraceae bacterium]